MKRSTIEDVAKQAGVSRQTVSRVINDSGYVSQDARTRVQAAVQLLDYRPNRSARTMVTRRSMTIGLVVEDIANPFYPDVARGAQDMAQRHGYNVFLANTDDHAVGEQAALESLARQNVDGIVLFGYHMSDEALRKFAGTFSPIVLVNRDFTHLHVSQIMVDNQQGGYAVGEHLIRQGHRKIGIISAMLSNSRRIDGFMQALDDNRLPHPTVQSSATIEGGYASTHTLLGDFQNLTAIFAFNDLMAIGAMQACDELGRRVGEDIAIVGFDDIRIASIMRPSLSSVRVDKYEIGELAVGRLVSMMAAEEESEKAGDGENAGIFQPITMPTELIIRQSSSFSLL
jgi:LacI family transcriptional regulator